MTEVGLSKIQVRQHLSEKEMVDENGGGI
jgi:hypothetical protein